MIDLSQAQPGSVALRGVIKAVGEARDVQGILEDMQVLGVLVYIPISREDYPRLKEIMAQPGLTIGLTWPWRA